MTRTDFATVSFKVLGAYFAVGALSGIVHTIYMVASGIKDYSVLLVFLFLLNPFVNALAAFFLVCRTSTCLRWCGEKETSN